MDLKKIDKAKLGKIVYWIVEGIGLLVLILSLVNKVKLLFGGGKSEEKDKEAKDSKDKKTETKK